MMTRALCALLCMLVCSGLGWARPDYKYGYVTGEGVRLRKGPGKDQPVAATVGRGVSLGVLTRRAGWVEVVPLAVFVRSQDIDKDGKVGPDGADMLWENRPDAPVLGHAAPGEKLQAHRGKTWSLVEAPSTFRYWLSQDFVTVGGIAARTQDLVPPARIPLSDPDYRKLANLRGLRMLVLPTDAPGRAQVESANPSSPRTGPSYSVKYTLGDKWYTVAGATDGLGGADLEDPLYIVQSDLLGQLIVGPMNYGGSKDYMMIGPSLLDASTSWDGRQCALSIFFDCSPGLDEGVIRKVLKSLRAVRL